MQSHRALALIPALLTLSAASAQQDNRPEPVGYKLDILIRDGDPAAKAGRRYTILTNTEGLGVIRLSRRMQFPTRYTPVAAEGKPIPTDFQFLERAVYISARVREQGPRLALTLTVEVTNVPEPEPPGLANIEQLKQEISTVIQPGKPTVVYSMDDPATSRRFDVEVTATKMN